MLKMVLPAALTAAMAFAVPGMQGELVDQQTPGDAVRFVAQVDNWDDIGPIQTTREVQEVPAPQSSVETEKLEELSKQIAADAAEIRRLTKETKDAVGLKGAGFQPPPQQHVDCKCPTLDEIRAVMRSELERVNLTVKTSSGQTKTTTTKVRSDGTPAPVPLQAGDRIIAIDGKPVTPHVYTGQNNPRPVVRYQTPNYDLRYYQDAGPQRGRIIFRGGGTCAGGVCR